MKAPHRSITSIPDGLRALVGIILQIKKVGFIRNGKNDELNYECQLVLFMQNNSLK